MTHPAAPSIVSSIDALETNASKAKGRIAAIGRKLGVTVIDWRIASPITRNDENYWDGLHYRLPIARRLTDDLIGAVLNGKESTDGSYRLPVR